MMSSAFSLYLAGGSLPPITQELCSTWNSSRTAIEWFGPTPTPTDVSAIVDAIAALESAVITLQNDVAKLKADVMGGGLASNATS